MSVRRCAGSLALLVLAWPAAHAADAAPAQLAKLVDAYYEEYLQLHPFAATAIGDRRYDDRLPPLAPEFTRRSQELEQRYAAALAAIDRRALAGEDLLTWEAFDFGRRALLAGFAWPTELLTLQQINNPAMYFAQLGGGQSVQSFATVRDYDNFAARIEAFPAWADQAIASMREGLSRGVVQPRIVMQGVLSQLATQIPQKPEDSTFWQPILHMPPAFPPGERERLTLRYRALIAGKLVPAYRRLHEFVRDEYLPKSRASVGLSALPDGARWYDWLARTYTTTDTPVAEIHRTGLREIERIDAEVARVSRRIGFQGDVAALADSMRRDPRFTFARPELLVDAYRGMQARVNAEVPRLFTLLPKAPLSIRVMEDFRAPNEAAAEYYAPAADGSRPGILYINTYDLPARPSYSVETIYLHEAVPGHHFQVALSVENTGLPRFRRFGTGDSFTSTPDSSTAFEEGWGLYAESLGSELGLYTDPYQLLGHLFAESWRAARLVVDTGMHAQGWTREQAIDYLLAHTALSRTDAVAEVERYIAWPGQALAYKTGQMKIRELRTRAERELGAKFDVRDFHAQVIGSGALPLAVLEAKIGRWIGETK